jgi:phosphatidylglycerol---prolipoprotein diacylglyceryl transferase
MNPSSYIVWNPDPVFLTIGPLELRYYGLFFASTILIGFFLLKRILRQYGYKDKMADDFLVWGVLGVIIGARLVHCFFYEPHFYLNNPIEILKIYRGGVASHGATIGLIIAVLIFIKKYKIKFFELSDGIVFAAAVGATLVRLGNFMNSEIVGAKTAVSWGFKFLRNTPDHYVAKNLATGNCDITQMDCLIQYWPVRHPSQLYEAAGGLTILAVMVIVSIIFAKKKKPGIYVGIFLTSYFSFRFFIEFVKEYQAVQEGIKMGQWLSIPFILFGIFAFYHAFKNSTDNKGDKKNEK